MATEASLRDLAKAYASGQLEKAKYRNDRNAFIEGVLSGSVRIRNAAIVSGHSTLSAESRVTHSTDKTTLMGSGNGPVSSRGSDTDHTPAAGTGRGKTGILIGGVIAVVLVIVGVVLLSGGEDDNSRTPAGSTNLQSISNSGAPSPGQASAAVSLVRSFLDTNSWAQSSIDNFLAEWNLLAETDRSALAGSIELGQLTNAIHKKLLEERALSGIGNPETSFEKQRVLVDFATRIGINDPRISLPEQTAPVIP